jgi:glyoxylase-like metal-dependent hydrolase (beta-lactamase superfamily II)
VLAEVAKVSRNRALYLTVTHSHPEHVTGMGAFPDGTVFVASRPVAAELARAAAQGYAGLAKLSPAIAEMLQGTAIRQPDVVFDAEHRLDLGGVRVRLLFLGPTHSEGDTLAYVEGDGVLYAGDVVLKKRFPSFGPSSTSRAWIEALDRVEALEPRVIVPSHGEIGDATTVDIQRRMLIEMRTRVAALRADGRTLGETTERVVGEFLQRYPDWRSTVPNEIAPIVRSMYAE